MARQPEFGQRLRDLRRERRMSQRQLAGDLITPSYVSLLESGGRVPTLDVVVHLANTLKVPVSELAGHDLQPPSAGGRGDKSTLLTAIMALSASDENDHATAAEALGRALAEARAGGDPARLFEVGMRLQHVLGTIGDLKGRVTLLEDLLDAPDLPASEELQVMVRTELAAALREAGRLPEARAAAIEVLDRVDPTSLRRTAQHVKALGVLISVLVELRDLDQVEVRLSRLLALADEVGGSGIRGRAHWVATLAFTRLGRPAVAHKHLRVAQESLASPEMSLRDWLRFCRTSASILLEVDGDRDEVKRWLDMAESTAEVLGIAADQKLVAAVRAQYELTGGDPARALALLDGILADPTRIPLVEVLRLRVVRARAAVELDRVDEAAAALRQVAIEYEQAGMFQLAVQTWRQIDELHRRGVGRQE